MRVNRDSSNVWYDFDPETVRNTEGGIHHGASAVQNVRAIGEDLGHALLPDRALTFAVAGAAMHWLFALPGLLVGFLADVLELAFFPFMLLKNLADAGGHGVHALINRAQGESDGQVDERDIRRFEWYGESSLQRQANAPWRPKPLAPPAPTGVKVGGPG